MLFDLRGKRKRFIQVIYATLAVLMGGGLIFFGIGSDVQGGLFDAFSDSSGGVTTSFADEADEIEEKLRRDPRNEQLLAQLIRARYSAGNSGIVVDETGQQSVSEEARQQFELATDAWDRYLKVAGKDPDPNVALLAANIAFLLAQSSTSTDEAEANLATAAEAQEFVAQNRPNVGTLSTLASYRYYNLDFKGGDATTQRALEQANNKRQRKSIKRQLDQIRKSAKQFEKQVKAANKAGGKGGEALEDPLGGLAGGGTTPGTAPAP
jgi:hypothetical protein